MCNSELSAAVWELGFQTVSARVIPEEERTNWVQLCPNETITTNTSKNRFPCRRKMTQREKKIKVLIKYLFFDLKF